MTRDFSEPWDPEDIFGRDTAKHQRARAEAAAEHNRKIQEHEAAQQAEIDKRTAASIAAFLGRTQLRDYRAAGVEPPTMRADGFPTCSLVLLLQMGWTIEQIGDDRVLIPPTSRSVHQRKSREDYGSDQGS